MKGRVIKVLNVNGLHHHTAKIYWDSNIFVYSKNRFFIKRSSQVLIKYISTVYTPPPPPCIHCIPQAPIRLLWLVVYDMVVMYIIHISKYILITTNPTNKLTEKKKKIVLQRVHGAHIDSNCSYVKLHLGLQSNLTTSLILF